MLLKILRYGAYTVVGIFALIGFAFTAVYFAMHFGLLNVRGSIAQRNAFFNAPQHEASAPCTNPSEMTCAWLSTPEWATISAGLTKDQEVIDKVSQETGIPARLIAATVVPEQTRFFTSERDVFKRYFEPLKILGSLSQFSLGVSGIKQETAKQIENYAASPTSPYYPGPDFAALMAYKPGESHDTRCTTASPTRRTITTRTSTLPRL
jgi:hypothetical protein